MPKSSFPVSSMYFLSLYIIYEKSSFLNGNVSPIFNPGTFDHVPVGLAG